MRCLYPRKIKTDEGNIVKVPCGTCPECKILRRAEWSVRLLHELEYWKEATFLTLTYDDEHLPEDCSIHPEHLKNFIKNVRHSIEKSIKYYACGEYGERSFRPHYHAIIYGLAPDDDVYQKHWHKGFNYTGTVTPDSCQYVAGYIQKKLYGHLADEMYSLNGLIPPFSRMSKGIGSKWIDTHSDQLVKDEFMCYTCNGKSINAPRYYLKRLGIDNSFEILKHKNKLIQEKLDKLKKQGVPSDCIQSVERLSAMQREFDCQSKDSMRQRKL